MKTEDVTFRVYCGTYHKYNSGSLAGAWLDLSDYADKEDFYAACAELHSDESDPEFMFQDYEDPTGDAIGESWVDENLWDLLELDDYERVIVCAYMCAAGCKLDDDAIENARDNYRGEFDSDEDFAQDFYSECYGEAIEAAENAGLVIDWSATWGCNLRHDFISADGHYFWSR